MNGFIRMFPSGEIFKHIYLLAYILIFTSLLSVQTAYGDSHENIDPEISAFSNMKEREQALDEREMKLDRREEALDDYQIRLNQQEARLDKIRAMIDQKLATIQQIEDENTKTIAGIYASADAKSAAAAIASMDIDKAVAIFKVMPSFSAGGIMTELGKSNPEFAAKIGEKLTPDFQFKTSLSNVQ